MIIQGYFLRSCLTPTMSWFSHTCLPKMAKIAAMAPPISLVDRNLTVLLHRLQVASMESDLADLFFLRYHSDVDSSR